MRDLLERLSRREDLGADGAHEIFSAAVRGELTELEICALLVALKTKGESPAEITGAATALRQASLPFPIGDIAAADTCGTGGDGAHTVNISTAAAFVAAAAGLPVAKHGNRSVSSKCGSADVLEACGVRLDPPPEIAARCLAGAGICFLMAPHYHPGVRHVTPVRRALATRTIFNVLGPLINPARPRWQVMGVYDPALCRPLAETLGHLGCAGALVVHGAGLDEIAVHGPTDAARLVDGRVEELRLTPEGMGLKAYPRDALAGGDAAANAMWLLGILSGAGQPAHNAAVAANAGALLWIAGRFPTINDAVAHAAGLLASGAPAGHLRRLIELSHGA